MSADNFGVVMKHPDGGYCMVHGSGSIEYTDDNPLTPIWTAPAFPTVKEVVAYYEGYHFEYGISIHPEVDQSLEYAEEQLKFWVDRVAELKSTQRLNSFLGNLTNASQENLRKQLSWALKTKRSFFTGNLEYRPKES